MYTQNLVVNKEVTLEARNVGGAIVDGGGTGGTHGYVIYVQRDSTFIGLHVRNGGSGYGVRGHNATFRVERSILTN